MVNFSISYMWYVDINGSVEFFVCWLIKCVAAASGVICLFVNYSYDEIKFDKSAKLDDFLTSQAGSDIG